MGGDGDVGGSTAMGWSVRCFLSPMVLTANDCDGGLETRDDEQNNCYNGATFFFEYH